MSFKQRLLVEGKDDLHVISHLLKHYKISCINEEQKKSTEDSGSIYIKDSKSITRLLQSLEVILVDGNLTNLGVILDADTNINSPWDAIKNILQDFGKTTLPKKPNKDGTIISLEQEGRAITVGIWIMPNNSLSGNLEHFIQHLVPKEDKLLPYAKDCIRNMPNGETRFSEKDKSKAEVHTWLAWQKAPGKPLGLAIKHKYFDANATAGRALVSWIRRVFDTS